MRISVFGLGHVGIVTAACLASHGHLVIGVDVDERKVRAINEGRSPIAEPKISELIMNAHLDGTLTATTDSSWAVSSTEVTLICVGTGSLDDGSQDLNPLEKACVSIGLGIASSRSRHTVVVRSTVLPGTILKRVQPLLEASSRKKCITEIGLVYNPEFFREGSAVDDFLNPAYTIIGSVNAASSEVVSTIYAKIDAPLYILPIPEAEMLKYALNTFHALKIAFANEIGRISKELGISSLQIMKLVAQDIKPHEPEAYLRPGFAFGGPCLLKDLRALLKYTDALGLELPVVQGIVTSNDLHIQLAIDFIISQAQQRIGVLGLSFKAGTHDLRGSPILIVVQALLEKGYELRVYDDGLYGTEGTTIKEGSPLRHHRLRIAGIEEVVAFAEVVVLGTNQASFIPYLLDCSDKTVVDLACLLHDQTRHAFQSHLKWVTNC